VPRVGGVPPQRDRAAGASSRGRAGWLPARAGLVLAALAATAGCAAEPPVLVTEHEPRAGVHVFVTRPFRVQPEPEPFLRGVVTAFVERLVLDGYHYTGTTWDPDGVEAVRTQQQQLNARFPGTVAIHLVFVEAPVVVGFGTAYRSVTCSAYDPSGRLILRGELEPPGRPSLRQMLLPARYPEAEGRSWGDRAWGESLRFVLPPRG